MEGEGKGDVRCHVCWCGVKLVLGSSESSQSSECL